MMPLETELEDKAEAALARGVGVLALIAAAICAAALVICVSSLAFAQQQN